MLTAKVEFPLIPLPGTSMFNNLTLPGARGSLGTVAQERATDKTTPLNRIVINLDLKE